MFIVIDGTDGSGKATQSKLLVESLKKEGKMVEYVDFPRYGQKSAAMVEEYLNGKLGSADEVGPYRASIIYAIDRYAASFEIRKWISEGKIIIANRYVSSNMGHQAGKIKSPEERDKFLNWLEDLEFRIFRIPKPDMVILLYVPPQIGQQLVSKKGYRNYVGGARKDIHESDLDHLKNASEAYLYVAKKFNWIVINCANENGIRSIEEIHKMILNEIKKYL